MPHVNFEDARIVRLVLSQVPYLKEDGALEDLVSLPSVRDLTDKLSPEVAEWKKLVVARLRAARICVLDANLVQELLSIDGRPVLCFSQLWDYLCEEEMFTKFTYSFEPPPASSVASPIANALYSVWQAVSYIPASLIRGTSIDSTLSPSQAVRSKDRNVRFMCPTVASFLADQLHAKMMLDSCTRRMLSVDSLHMHLNSDFATPDDARAVVSALVASGRARVREMPSGVQIVKFLEPGEAKLVSDLDVCVFQLSNAVQALALKSAAVETELHSIETQFSEKLSKSKRSRLLHRRKHLQLLLERVEQHKSNMEVTLVKLENAALMADSHAALTETAAEAKGIVSEIMDHYEEVVEETRLAFEEAEEISARMASDLSFSSSVEDVSAELQLELDQLSQSARRMPATKNEDDAVEEVVEDLSSKFSSLSIPRSEPSVSHTANADPAPREPLDVPDGNSQDIEREDSPKKYGVSKETVLL
jgi:hypothetical protein